MKPIKPTDSTQVLITLITLEVSGFCLAVYGLEGASQCVFRDAPLTDFLPKLWKQMLDTKNKLNRGFRKFDKTNRRKRTNSRFVKRLLSVGAWAYNLTLELQPFGNKCRDAMGSNTLRHFYIKRLEEIYTKCFAAAHILGSANESALGLQGLVTDFEFNGGVNQETGGKGSGFEWTILMFLVAYVNPHDRAPIIYQRFGELMEALAALVENKYPDIMVPLGNRIRELVESKEQGFGRTDITSPAKTEMLQKLGTIVNLLAPQEGGSKEEVKVA